MLHPEFNTLATPQALAPLPHLRNAVYQVPRRRQASSHAAMQASPSLLCNTDVPQAKQVRLRADTAELPATHPRQFRMLLPPRPRHFQGSITHKQTPTSAPRYPSSCALIRPTLYLPSVLQTYSISSMHPHTSGHNPSPP